MTERLPTDVVEARLNHLIDRARRGALLPEEADQFTTELRDLVRRLEDEEDTSRRLLTQRQEMAAERYAWEKRADKAKRAVNVLAEQYRALEQRVTELTDDPRVTELEAEVARLSTTPAEHCGHQPSEVFTWRHPGQYGECVLRPGHSGSHADEHGMRWWLHTEEQQDPAANPKQLAYDAVFAYLRSQPVDFMPLTVVDRNAMIWRAVHAALDATPGPERQDNPHVQGRCPACGNERLFLGDGGHVTCPRIDCPNPTGADDLLHNRAPDWATKPTTAETTEV